MPAGHRIATRFQLMCPKVARLQGVVRFERLVLGVDRLDGREGGGEVPISSSA
jgi:hypothetical protein